MIPGRWLLTAGRIGKSQCGQCHSEKIDFRLTTSPSLANLRRHEQYRVEFW